MTTPQAIRQEITQKIVDALEQGTIIWRQPWCVHPNAGAPANAVSSKSYRGINVLLLQMAAMSRGFHSRWWATYDQVTTLGGTVKRRPDDVRPGEWGTKIVFFKPLTRTVRDEVSHKNVEKTFPLLKTYTVFNVDQCDGEKLDHFRVTEQAGAASITPDFAEVQAVIAATGVQINHGGDKAFYARPTPEGSWPHHTGGDNITMPQRGLFCNTDGYYETLLHELAHWSEVRTGWNYQREGYAAGELAAELAATMLSSELRIPQGEGLENHAAYLRHWLDAMRADSSFIFRVSSQASKVCDHILSYSRQPVEVAA